MENKLPKPTRPPTQDLSDLVVPRRPAGVPYADGEDYDAQALLTVNGYGLGTSELIAALGSNLGIFQAAAARVLGSQGERSAIQALSRLAQDVTLEETVRVQAAYALARLDQPEAREILASLVKLNPEASPAPLQAANALARLGDPRGFTVVRRSLDSRNGLTAMIACKQLFAFVEHEGHPLPGGGSVQVYEAFRRALERPERNIIGEVLAQLSGLKDEQARALLKEYASG